MSKYVQVEFVIDKNRIGFDISWYRDLKCLQIAIPFIVITFNFSGEWTGGWKSQKGVTMSKEKPEVGDVWITTKGTKILIVDVESSFVGALTKSFFGHAIPIQAFDSGFTYLGKSKANINDLFEVEE